MARLFGSALRAARPHGLPLVYEVRMLCDGEMKEVLLDAESGAILNGACKSSV